MLFAAPPDPPNEGVLWRSIVDNLVLETIASLFINVTAVSFGNLGFEGVAFTEPWLQLVPALAVGLVLLTCKDEHYLPPDATPTITLLFFCLGAYGSWVQAAARLLGHCLGFAIALVLCQSLPQPPQALPLERPGGAIFASEVIATCVEHMSIVYLLLPLLPSHSARFDPRQGPANTPNNTAMTHAAAAFALSHWYFPAC